MRAIIPVAGFGTRLKPHTHSAPKVLLNVGGKPMLAHILDKLVEEGVSKATFIIGHLGDKIKSFVNENYKNLTSDFVEQKELLGLGHAIYTASHTFDEKDLIIILGDTIFDVDLKNVFSSNYSSLGVKTVEDPRRFGVAIKKDDFISELVEKPQNSISNLALVGLYYIKNPDLLKECLDELVDKEIKTRGEYQLTDALQLMIQKNEKFTSFNVEGWYDCGKPETLLSTNNFLLSKSSYYRKLDGVVIKEPVFISDSAVVENSVIGPYTTVAGGCSIKDSVIRNSIISDDAIVEKSLLENSIVGSSAIIKGSFRKINAGDSSEIEFY